MCTWAINTVIDDYNRLGRPIFACSMDLNKAFDMVSWAKLFPKLLKRKISPLILRCLIHIFSYQMCNVNDLIIQLRNLKVGCQLNCLYLGIWVYADDIILLSPSRSGLQLMTNVCENLLVFIS